MVLLFSKLSTMSFPCIVCEQNVRPKQHALECDSCFSGNTDYVIVGPSLNYLLKSSQCVVLLYVSYISIDTHH